MNPAFNYNKVSGHVKRDGAVIGLIKAEGETFHYTSFLQGDPKTIEAPALPALLASIKHHFSESAVALDTAPEEASPSQAGAKRKKATDSKKKKEAKM